MMGGSRPWPHPSVYLTKFRQQPQAEVAAVVDGIQKILPSTYLTCQCSGASSGSGSSSKDSFERVINVANCQLCHCPWPNKRAEMFIITYFAVCTSGDWAKIDMGYFGVEEVVYGGHFEGF